MTDVRNVISTAYSGTTLGGKFDDTIKLLSGGIAKADGRSGGYIYIAGLADGYATTISDTGLNGNGSIFVYDIDYFMGKVASMHLDMR